MKKIILVGGGGHCKSVIDVVEQEGKFKIAGIIDRPNLYGSKILGYSVIGCDDDLKILSKKYSYALVTVGQIKSSSLRKKLFYLLNKAKFILPKIISPSAYVSKHSSVGRGSIVMHNAIINANSSIGDNCIINTNALVEHDCKISEHCHISTKATINGGVSIKSGCFIGSNATIKQNLTIKKDSFIKACSLIK